MFCRGNCTGSILITYYDIIVIIIDIYTKYVLYARHAHTHTCNGLAYVAAQIDTLADQSGEKFGAGEEELGLRIIGNWKLNCAGHLRYESFNVYCPILRFTVLSGSGGSSPRETGPGRDGGTLGEHMPRQSLPPPPPGTVIVLVLCSKSSYNTLQRNTNALSLSLSAHMHSIDGI